MHSVIQVNTFKLPKRVGCMRTIGVILAMQARKRHLHGVECVVRMWMSRTANDCKCSINLNGSLFMNTLPKKSDDCSYAILVEMMKMLWQMTLPIPHFDMSLISLCEIDPFQKFLRSSLNSPVEAKLCNHLKKFGFSFATDLIKTYFKCQDDWLICWRASQHLTRKALLITNLSGRLSPKKSCFRQEMVNSASTESSVGKQGR